MPPLNDFSNNPFRTRSDCTRAASALVLPLIQYRSPLSARIKLSTATGAGFGETAAQLEGFARPFWVVPHLLQAQSTDGDVKDQNLHFWVDGLKAGTDPDSPEYWGDLRNFDQRMVEMESIAYAILLAPEYFAFEKDEVARRNLVAWLSQINRHSMPRTNWLWFRVLVNLALHRNLGIPIESVRPYIDESLDTLDSLYMGQGWSSDGLWSEERKQADYYSGSFALQFAPLIYVRFASDYDIARAECYRSRAKIFAKHYWRYFSPTGAAIPFGRSLTYRFAFAAFWAAASAAQIDLPAPLNEPGVVKGLLLRHLRWWAQQHDIFNADGTMHIGYTYPNMHIAENYTSPQSPYWCLKSFLVLSLAEDNPFWQSEEQPYPRTGVEAGLAEVEILWPPRHIMCNSPEHHFLLSSGQSTAKRFQAREAKYGKLAYSSAFGFSVPCGSLLEQIAPDSTLAVCLQDGDELWKVHSAPYNVTRGEVRIDKETLPTLTSSWKPWNALETSIVTTLIPPSRQWPGWHLRLHRIKNLANQAIRIVDGGFAISAETAEGLFIPETDLENLRSHAHVEAHQGWYTDQASALVLSKTSASGVVDLSASHIDQQVEDVDAKSATMIIHADPNT